MRALSRSIHGLNQLDRLEPDHPVLGMVAQLPENEPTPRAKLCDIRGPELLDKGTNLRLIQPAPHCIWLDPRKLASLAEANRRGVDIRARCALDEVSAREPHLRRDFAAACAVNGRRRSKAGLDDAFSNLQTAIAHWAGTNLLISRLSVPVVKAIEGFLGSFPSSFARTRLCGQLFAALAGLAGLCHLWKDRRQCGQSGQCGNAASVEADCRTGLLLSEKCLFWGKLPNGSALEAYFLRDASEFFEAVAEGSLAETFGLALGDDLGGELWAVFEHCSDEGCDIGFGFGLIFELVEEFFCVSVDVVAPQHPLCDDAGPFFQFALVQNVLKASPIRAVAHFGADEGSRCVLADVEVFGGHPGATGQCAESQRP